MISKMSDIFTKISDFGIKPELSPDKAEKMRLVNIICFLGVPICLSYSILFGVTAHYFHAFVFICGLFIFIIPIMVNAWKGLKLSRPIATISIPFFWAFVTVISGRDTGFYLGFIVFCLPPILFFSTFREALFYLWTSIFFFILSMIGMMIFPPLDTFPFAMEIFLTNLFMVFTTIILITYFFKKELDESRERVQEKNREISDSINYAKRIQNAMLPADSFFQKKLKDYFLLYKPKDIVAGDFYWMEEVDGKILIAAADCTGHGVPGALVSIVCYNALNKAVFEYKLADPGKILDLTRQFVIEQFSKTDEKVKDGMDISFASIDLTTGVIKWAGANNPLWYVQSGKLKVIPSDKQPIGITEKPGLFTSNEIQLIQGDCIYLFTDGFADQFGGKNGKKFMYKQLKEIIISNSSKTMNEQKNILTNAIDKWMGNLEQVDDILIIGIKV